MRKALLGGVGIVAVASTAGLSLNAFSRGATPVAVESRLPNALDTIRENTFVDAIPVGGLTTDEAARQVRIWWEAEKLKKLTLTNPKLKGTLPQFKPSELGVTVDDAGTIAQLPLQGIVGGGETTMTQTFHPRFKPNDVEPKALQVAVTKALGKPTSARVTVVKGAFVRTPEISTAQFDQDKLFAAVTNAIYGKRDVTLPLKEGDKKVTDEDLKQITEVVAEFSTKFSARNRPRANNIKVATSKIDGLVLAPGERFSFNSTVGQRTIESGFKEAGVYVNGKHDTGVGGGICQVSTTLYNAALFSNMKIARRTNHSLPVPYVPIGRDATVNWGAQDLVLENNFDKPIAISATYVPGKLTFRILGQKQPGLEIKIERENLKSWKPAAKTVSDSSLPAGKKKVIEAGSTGYSCTTYRMVYENGELVKKEPLGRSTYSSSPAIVAVGTKAKAAPVVSNPPPIVVPPPAETTG